ncbi:Selenide, water dikinase (modular protein) [Verrucomicrobia bacterium]|nr:Selenide, water dikinase (modular protein) [Verrucomicrobiota bacterium]
MNIDLAKRRRVMERSQLLGHCICDVRRACPCDLLRDQNLCPCAGERLEPSADREVRLTQLAPTAGCASKIAPADLDAVLGRLPAVEDPAVISGLAAADDAAIYRIADDVYLVQTVDVFTPCVDSPRLFGKICAANCLSDIYAMGGEPRTALSVLAFPSETLPAEVMYEMLAGAMEVFKEAGVALIGGHSVKDDQIKLGFAITGVISMSVASSLEQPGAGDMLVLTKPLGTGVLTFGRQIGRDYPVGLTAAEAAMATLNKAAADAMREAGASACTDVTGFGLFAHLLRMLRPAKLGAELQAEALPAFEGVVEALRQGVIPGAIERNREYVAQALETGPGVEEALVNLGLDAQTSGGLLIAVPHGRLGTLGQALSRRGVSGFVIGKVIGGAAGKILLSSTAVNASNISIDISNDPPERIMMTPTPEPPVHAEGCCAEVFKSQTKPGSATESQQAFAALMRSVQSSGALDEKTKELILFSLVLSSRCQPCFDVHYQKARALGITQPELDEAAWCAIVMGGAPVRMFYQECLKSVEALKPS